MPAIAPSMQMATCMTTAVRPHAAASVDLSWYHRCLDQSLLRSHILSQVQKASHHHAQILDEPGRTTAATPSNAWRTE